MSGRLRNKLILWALLSLPAAAILVRYSTAADLWPGDMLHSTGEWSARMLIVALCLTPLAQLLQRSDALRWLIRHRRAFGVAAFGYAALHLIFYVLDMETLAAMAAEIGAPGIWTAWIAFLCMLPPALASNDAAMRRLGRNWKRIQRLAYPAALLTLIHWLLVHDGSTAAFVHFAPLAALQSIRVVRLITKPREGSYA